MTKDELELSLNKAQVKMFIQLLTEKMRVLEEQNKRATEAAEKAIRDLEYYKREMYEEKRLQENPPVMGKGLGALIEKAPEPRQPKDGIREFWAKGTPQ